MFDKYEKTDKTKWAEKATRDLKGTDVYGKFRWDLQGLSLDPYYDQSDLDTTDYHPFSNRLAEDIENAQPRGWRNVESIQVSDLKEANADALKALFMGADGVEFNFAYYEDDKVNFEILLNDIMADFCHLSFTNIRHNDALAVIYFLNNHYDPNKLQGTIHLADNDAEHLTDMIQSADKLPHYKFSEAACELNITFSEQIANLITQANRTIRSLILHGVSTDIAVKSVSLTTCVGTDFFGEIAKVRALRRLFYQVARAYGADNFLPETLMIKCKSPSWTKEAYQPHANMLKASTASLAAILGGCDILVVSPEDKEDIMQKRIARNVSTILKEESFLGKTNDPAAGSYFIESLTEELAKNAWNLFQSQLDQ